MVATGTTRRPFEPGNDGKDNGEANMKEIRTLEEFTHDALYEPYNRRQEMIRKIEKHAMARASLMGSAIDYDDGGLGCKVQTSLSSGDDAMANVLYMEQEADIARMQYWAAELNLKDWIDRAGLDWEESLVLHEKYLKYPGKSYAEIGFDDRLLMEHRYNSRNIRHTVRHIHDRAIDKMVKWMACQDEEQQFYFGDDEAVEEYRRKADKKNIS